jgi:tRNA (uracil-5-)-methyltransferase
MGMGVCRTPIVGPISEESGDHNDTDDTTVSSSSSSALWVIFVPNTIPGELVRVKVYRNYKSYSDADLLQVLEPSPHRVQPVCALATLCGGCQYQHMSIHAQREWKTAQVVDVLSRMAGLDQVHVRPTVGTEQVWQYRSKITPHYEAPIQIANASFEIQEIGFKQKNSRRLVDVPYCHIATEAINEKLDHLRHEKRNEALRGELKRSNKGATLLLRDANEGVITDNNMYVTTTVAGLTFRFLAGNFFQNNPFMLPVMVNHVVEAATKPSPAGLTMTHLIDCYCGSGLFGLTTAAHFQQCVGIEVNANAIEEAKINAELNGISNCAFVAASAEAIFESPIPVEGNGLVQDFPRPTTVVVCDPPRKGCSEEFLEQLFVYSPQRVVYMSCDVATQARDVKSMVAAGYTITSVQPFDLFPQTRHIECLIVLEKTP